MYIVGHCWVTHLSRQFAEEEVFGEGLVDLMLPDYVSCHAWAYDRAWETPSRSMALIQAHMIGDWYVHFGPARAEPRRRVGWAYRRMRLAVSVYDEFFGRAAAEGLRPPGDPCDSVRGFSHTMLELAIDTHLCRRGLFDPYFESARLAISTLENVAKVEGIVGRLRIETDAPDLPALILDFRNGTLAAQEPAELAYLVAGNKFGLAPSKESLAFVEEYLDRILSEIEAGELEALCHEIAGAIAEPARMPLVHLPRRAILVRGRDGRILEPTRIA